MRSRPLEVPCVLLRAGCWVLGAGCWVLGAGCRVLVLGALWPVPCLSSEESRAGSWYRSPTTVNREADLPAQLMPETWCLHLAI